MKLLEVGDEHYIGMLADQNQVMFHHQIPVAAHIEGIWYRAPVTNLISVGHVRRYMVTADPPGIHWVTQQMMDKLVEEL